MPGSIFISYRREQNPKDARALFERLRREFGEGEVFIDLEGIEPGEDFVETLERQLDGCRVLLALIGDRWAEATDRHGRRRLDDENDFVRIELRTALRRGIRVIPVLVDGAPPVTAAQLPGDLQGLVRRQALSLDFHKFDTDVGRLVHSLRRLLASPSPSTPPPPPPPQPSPPPLSTASSTPSSTAAPTRSNAAATPTQPPSPSAAPAPAPKAAPQPSKAREPDPPHSAPPGTPSTGNWPLLAAVPVVLALAVWGLSQLGPSDPAPVAPSPAAPPIAPPPPPPPAPVAAQSPATRAVPPAGTRFRDCEDNACPSLVVLPEGRFTMGSPAGEQGRYDDEGPQHEVRIGYRLAVMEAEVTRGQYRAFVGDTRRVQTGCAGGGNWQQPGFEQTDDHPVVCVSWDDGRAFAQWLSRRTGKAYRLLSEAEWEYAARAGSQSRYSFGDDDRKLCRFANVADRSAKAQFPVGLTVDCDDGAVHTSSVRKYQPNAFGLYDMHGNVWEWVQDCWPEGQKGYEEAPSDGSALQASACSRRLLRGGAWNSFPWSARSALRLRGDPSDRVGFTGLRLARMLP